MGALDNPKYEKFAMNLAAGMNQTDAHEAAGYKRNTANACVLARKQEVVDRVDEIKALRQINGVDDPDNPEDYEATDEYLQTVDQLEMTRRMRALYRKSVAAQNFKVALDILKEERLMLGIGKDLEAKNSANKQLENNQGAAKLDISIMLKSLEALGDISSDAKDITPVEEPKEVPLIPDFDINEDE